MIKHISSFNSHVECAESLPEVAQGDRATAAEKAVLEVAPGSQVTAVDCDLQDFESAPGHFHLTQKS